MLPFCVNKLILDLKHDLELIKNDIFKWKYSFCMQFQNEICLESGDYSQSVFDYLYNLFTFKKVFSKEDFRFYLEQFKELDFKRPVEVNEYFSKKYMEFLLKNKTYFMDYFGFKHEDSMYIERKIREDRNKFVQKLMEY